MSESPLIAAYKERIEAEGDNVFLKLKNPAYGRMEISWLLDWCERHSIKADDVYQDAYKLLGATANFRSKTALGQFAEVRNANATDAELLALIDEIGVKLKAAAEYLKTLDKKSQVFFSAAIRYCATSVEQRLYELQQQNDRIWQLYNNANNTGVNDHA